MPSENSSTRLMREMLETADDLNACGVMSDEVYRKITMRGFVGDTPSATHLTGDEIRALRQKANMSQAVFAKYLNLTVGYLSQLERGAKRPQGAALALLNVIRRQGMHVVM